MWLSQVHQQYLKLLSSICWLQFSFLQLFQFQTLQLSWHSVEVHQLFFANLKRLYQILKSVFSESSTFSKTIFDFLVRLPVILLLDQDASIKLLEKQQENGRFLFENVLLSEYTNFILHWILSIISVRKWIFQTENFSYSQVTSSSS